MGNEPTVLWPSRKPVLLFKSCLAWLVILVLAMANGALRDTVLIPLLGKSGGFVVSGLLLCCFIAFVAYGLIRFQRGIASRQGVLIGMLWLGLTLVFEFSFGHFVLHQSWAELRAAYTFKDGNLWPVILLVTFLAPYIAAVFQTRR